MSALVRMFNMLTLPREEEATPLTRRFTLLLICTIGLTLVALAVNLLVDHDHYGLNIAFLIIQVTLFFAARRDYTPLAGILYCSAAWLALTYHAYHHGVSDPILMCLGPVIIAASILLGWHGALVYSGLAVLSIVVATTTPHIHQSGIMDEVILDRLLAANYGISFLGFAILITISSLRINDLLVANRHARQALSEQKLELEQEKNLRQQAQQSQMQFISLLETMPDFVAVADNNLRITYLNQNGRQIFGLDEKQAKELSLARLLPPDVLEFTQQGVKVATEKGVWSRKIHLRRDDDHEIPILQIVTAHGDAQPEYYSVVMRNLRSLMGVEAEHKALRSTEERLSVFQGLLTDLVSDLKTPLTIIMSGLYHLEKIEEPSKRREKVTFIQKQVQQLEKLISDVLAYAQLNQLPPLETQAVQLKPVLQDVISALKVLATEKSIRVRLEVDAQTPPVQANEEKLYRALINLVENAVRYTLNGGGVTVRASFGDNGGLIEVEDNGLGIAPGDLEHIFERFFRTDSARAFYDLGSGLGLAITKKIVDLHDGSISVESTPLKGTTFHIWLPMAHSDQ